MSAAANKLILWPLCFAALALCTGLAYGQIQAGGPLITTESNRMVSMRDGVSVALDIYRPAQSGSYPTLYASAPYPHGSDNTPPDNAMTGPVAWFVSQGFNYVIASTRGTGASEGTYEFLSREEQQDHYEIIEWIAEQAWSDGRVLGAGAEYYAAAQWHMAIQNPPSLRCIAPVNGIVRPYHDWAFPGGLSNPDFLQGWYETAVRQQNAFPASGRARLVDYDMRLELLRHPLYDNFWQIRSTLPAATAINTPVFIADSWQNQQGLMGNLLILERLNNINKMAIFGTEEALLQNQTFLEQELLPYYHWCLQTEGAADFSAGPQLRYQTRGQTRWQPVESWPPPQAEQTALVLNRQSLDASVPASLNLEVQPNSLALSRYGNDPDSLTFISDPLVNELEIAGPLMLELYAASSQTDTAFSVSLEEQLNLSYLRSRFDLPDLLRDVIQSGTGDNRNTQVIDVTSGTLKASLRSATRVSVENRMPAYSFDEAIALIPTEVTRFNIALHPVAHRFRAGSRLILTITQAQDDALNTLNREDSVYHSDRYPSRLWLPIQEGSLETSPAQTDARDVPVDIQSEEITDPFTINFDPGFSTELNNENSPDGLTDPVENPLIFIRPGVRAEDSPAGQSGRQ
tara:strand:+ start:119307 stop:121196 length:1890 start_codon:yes stop_codon:yes gene_type:complete